jgi:uncharacterized protein
MKRDFNNLKELEDFFNQANVFENFAIENIGVFGSFARGEKARDIDILIEKKNLEKLGDFYKFLENNSVRPFDVMLSKYADPIILNRAKKDLKYVTRYKK